MIITIQKDRTLADLIEYANKLVECPSEENMNKFKDLLVDFSDLSKITCSYCKHFTNRIDNGEGRCKNCLYHYLRYSTHNFAKTPLNFELKK